MKVKQKYPSIGRYFDIEVEVNDDIQTNKRNKKVADAEAIHAQKKIQVLKTDHYEVIMIRRSSEPNQLVRKLYDALKYKYAPSVKRKSVVHKSELEKLPIH